MKPGESGFVEEATRRSMHRLMATARVGRQAMDHGEAFEVVVQTEGRTSSVAFQLSDTQAVLLEMEEGAPCSLCGTDPCEYVAVADR